MRVYFLRDVLNGSRGEGSERGFCRTLVKLFKGNEMRLFMSLLVENIWLNYDVLLPH